MAIPVRGLTPLLQVYDMPASVRFYRDLLGFEIVEHSPTLDNGSFHWALLRLGGAELMLNTAYEFDSERPVPADPARLAAHGDTCIYLGCPDVDAAFEEITAKGWPAGPPAIAPYGMKQLYLKDPDGYGICLQWPVE
ncbi:MAG: VOC family protein [Acidobacteria bacterium]|nr:VOC family protein [Acidobacteriota bacterium]